MMSSPKKPGTFQPQVPVSDSEHVLINTKEKVGTWLYGDYYRGVSKKYNKEVMVKMVDTSKFPLKQKNLETEINLLQKLKVCPNVVEFMEYKYYDKTLVIVTEACNAGNLRDFLSTHAPVPEEQALRILLQLVCGLKALHQQNYTHAAVRPECILMQEVNGTLNAKLSEFIFARAYKGDNSAKFPLPYDSPYLAPEVLKDLKFDPKSDIWSLGMIYYELLFGALPWTGKTKEELKDNILNKKLDLKNKKGVSDTSIDFLTRCLHRDVKKRIGWKEIGEHRLLFRGLFLNDDGTYKLFNEDYGQHSPRRGNLVYGNRNAESSFPASPKSCRVVQPRLESPKLKNDLNQSVTSARSNFVLKPTSPFHIQDQEQSFGNGSKENVEQIPSNSEIKERSSSPISFKYDQTAPQEDEVLQKKPDPEFYSNLVSKVGETDDYYLTKFMNKEPLDQKGPFSKKSFVKPFKWLANKAEIVSEIYEMAIRNPHHCCYERIIKLLNEETASWHTIDLVSAMQKQFTQSVESTSKQEEAQPMAYPKGIKNHSMIKKEKNQQMAVLIEDIVSSFTNANENCKANNEDMVQIAANFKVLREYDEIGDSVMKELDVMKNSLIVFYRKRDHGHIRYILSIRNLI